MIIGTERPISPIEKTLNAFISYHLESIWELALYRIHGFNSDIKVAPFPKKTKK